MSASPRLKQAMRVLHPVACHSGGMAVIVRIREEQIGVAPISISEPSGASPGLIEAYDALAIKDRLDLGQAS